MPRGRLLTVREYTMMEIMNRITDKIEWNMKIFDAEISQKWQNEAMGTKEKDVSKKMMDYVRLPYSWLCPREFVLMFEFSTVSNGCCACQDVLLL